MDGWMSGWIDGSLDEEKILSRKRRKKEGGNFALEIMGDTENSWLSLLTLKRVTWNVFKSVFLIPEKKRSLFPCIPGVLQS